MRKRHVAWLALVAVSVGYVWGVLGIHSDVPPYPQLRSAEEYLWGTPPRERTRFEITRRAAFEAAQSDADIVFIGDSMIANVEWQDAFRDQKVANRGIGRDRVQDVLDRISGIRKTNAKTAVLWVGINDVLDGVDPLISQKTYAQLVSELRSAGMHVKILSLLPGSRDYRSETGHADKVRRFNQALSGLARDGVAFINIYSDMTQNGYLRRELSYDGLHLNVEGVHQLLKLLRTALGSNGAMQATTRREVTSNN